jgi:predicted metal-binding membrane protein
MTQGLILETVLRRDRLLVIMALLVVIVAGWIYILLGAGMGMTAFEMTTAPFGGPADMARKTEMAMTPAGWSPAYAILMFFMWWIMMVAMMLPSAVPMILVFSGFHRNRREQGAPYVPTVVFALGYLLVWAGFSLVATAAQWSLGFGGLLSSMMASTSVLFGAVLLIAAGAYQLTPLKYACLKHCRSPLVFMSRHWRPGVWGALQMGIMHGAFCTGCCWFLMALLFYGGVMNLFWIIGLALLVLLEKVTPAGHWIGWIIGVGLIAWGGGLLLMAA